MLKAFAETYHQDPLMLGFCPWSVAYIQVHLQEWHCQSVRKGSQLRTPCWDAWFFGFFFSYRELTINLDSFLKCDIKINFQMDPRLNVRQRFKMFRRKMYMSL